MLTLALVLFGLAAVLGLVVAMQILGKRPTAKPVAVAHGLAAATALVLLIVHALSAPHRLLTVAIVLFVIAALGGAWLFANDLRSKPGPGGLIAIHALAALAGVGLLVAVFLG